MHEELACGERVICCLLGEPTDRTPFGVGVGWDPWGETLERWRSECGDTRFNSMAYEEYFSYDKSFALPSFYSGIFPFFEEKIFEETDEYTITQHADGIVRRQYKNTDNMPEFIAHPVKSRGDWERLKAERLRIDAPGRLIEDWAAFRARLAGTGEAVQVGSCPYGIFGSIRELMGAEQCLIGFYADAAMIRDMMEHLTTLWLALWERVVAEVRIDHIHIWEDMSGKHGSLISPAMAEEFMMPCYDRIVAFARAHGVRLVSVDTDGDCRELVPIMIRHGINVFFPFEVQAGNDILAYRAIYPELGILGGLDKRALAEGRPAIDREVERARRMLKQGRYIPGFDHLIPPDVPWADFRYATERLREVCGKSNKS